ncbi:MAG: hypothetical protein AB1486_03325 [Planctomycetota bacterium]
MRRSAWIVGMTVAMGGGLAGSAAAQSPSAVNAGWADDGTVVRLRTDADRVSIGTRNPSGKLHIAGGDAIFEDRVGIGTTDPWYPLDIRVPQLAILGVRADDPFPPYGAEG